MAHHQDKNDPGRFLGEGVSFRAKLIGVLEVPEARGDRMCQEALADLKMAIRAAGEHKQRIQVHVAIDGLRLRDDKTGDSLYHHPVHKISFIAQDMTDSRAFGYIFGSPDIGHRFFGIKTDKAASQVVIAMRDLFQVVFELKKKEIDLAKQQLEGKSIGGALGRLAGALTEVKSKSISSVGESSVGKGAGAGEAGGEGGVAALVDLEQELSSLRRGLTQVEGLAPAAATTVPASASATASAAASADPFGDSFIPAQIGRPHEPAHLSKGLLPPPPSGAAGRTRSAPAPAGAAGQGAGPAAAGGRALFSPGKPPAALPFDLAAVAAEFEPPAPAPAPAPPAAPPLAPPDKQPEATVSQPGTAATTSLGCDVFTELDPLGTGRSRPYVDKKLFFQELKNPPKKVLKDLVPTAQTLLTDIVPAAAECKTEQYSNTTTMASLTRHSGGSVAIAKPALPPVFFASDPFAETDPFDTSDPFSDSFKDDPFTGVREFPKPSAPRAEDPRARRVREGLGRQDSTTGEGDKNLFNGPLQVSLPPEPAPKSPRLQRQLLPIRSRRRTRSTVDTSDPFLESFKDDPFTPCSSEWSSVRQRPQAGAGRVGEGVSPPPPLPPKKAGEPPLAPPPRPPHDDEPRPPLPRPARKKEPLADRSTKPRASLAVSAAAVAGGGNSSEDEYLTPAPPPLPAARRFDITLSQLLTCSMAELAHRLRVPAATLSSMTLPQLTDYLRSYLAADNDRAHIHVEPSLKSEKNKPTSTTVTSAANKLPPAAAAASGDFRTHFEDDFTPSAETGDTFVANFDDFDNKVNPGYDRYAAFREIQEQELKAKSILDPVDDDVTDANGKRDSDEKDEMIAIEDLRVKQEEAKETSRSPLRTLDELTLDTFNMFRNSVSPKPTQIDAKIEDIKNVIKNLQIEQNRRSVSPRENNVSEAKEEDANDRYAALREITITEPPHDEFESLPPDMPKERKRSDEKSDGFDNSDFFDCIDNSSLSFTHVEDAFRKSPVVKDKEEQKVEAKEAPVELLPSREVQPPVREAQPPARLSTGSISDVVSGSSPDAKEKSVGGGGCARAGRWSVLGAGASPWSSDSRESRDSPGPAAWHAPHVPHARRRHHAHHAHHSPVDTRAAIVQTSSSSRDASPWDEEPPLPVARLQRAPAHHRDRDSRHNSSGSRECLDSGSGREKEKMRDKRDSRDRDLGRDSRESGSARERDRRDSGSGRDRRDLSKERDHRDGRDHREGRDRRDRRSRDRENESWDRDRTYSRERGYRDSRSRERPPKDYRDKDRHRMTRHSYDEDEDYSDGCGSGRSSPRDRWPEQRWRRDERNYGSLGWRETKRRHELRQGEEVADRRYGSTLGWSARRSGSAAARREPERDPRRRSRRDEPRPRHHPHPHPPPPPPQPARDYRFSNDFSPRDRDPGSPFDHEYGHETPPPPPPPPPLTAGKKRTPYASLEGQARFSFEPEESLASPAAGGARARDSASPAASAASASASTRFRFDSDSVSPRSLFEDDFTQVSTPRARTASIAEEDEADLPPLRSSAAHAHSHAHSQAHRDIKKSESVNIFTRESDPFENDDFFACTGSDRAARRDNWPGDFHGFRNA